MIQFIKKMENFYTLQSTQDHLKYYQQRFTDLLTAFKIYTSIQGIAESVDARGNTNNYFHFLFRCFDLL